MMTNALHNGPLLALLDWYRAMGVEDASGEHATNWLQRGSQVPGQGFNWPPGACLPPSTIEPLPNTPLPLSAPPQSRPPLPAAVPVSRAPPPSPDNSAARQLAASARTLDELAAALARFDGCALKSTAKNLCLYRGAPAARLMLIGEAPGREEDLEGKPFVGRAGQLLDKIFAAAGLSGSELHITNTVYWRPPGNRTPTTAETEACRPFLERQVELVAPDIVVLLGAVAAKHILALPEGIMRVRGQWHSVKIGSRDVRVMATLHPAYLLRTPAAKRHVWRDFLAIRGALNS